MTSTLTQERIDVAEALTGAGIKSSDYIPEVVRPPIGLVAAGSPYVEKGQTFADHMVRLEVTLVASKATNKGVTAQMDDLVTKAVRTLRGWTLESVSQPFQLETGGDIYLAVDVTITQFIEIKEA